MIRVFRHYIPRSLVVLGTSEAFILIGAVYLGVTIRLLEFNPTDKLLVGHVWPRALVFTVVVMLLMAGMGLYQRGLRDDLRGIYLRLALAFAASLGTLFALFYLFRGLYFGNFAFVVAFVVAVVGITLFRTLVFQFAAHDLFRRRVLVLGTGRAAGEVERLRRRSDWRDRELVGFVHMRSEQDAVAPERILHVKTSLRHLAAELDIHEIVVAVDERRESFPVSEVLDCKMSGIQVIDLVTFLEQATGKITLDALNPSTLIFADGFIQAVIKGYVHRLFDLVVSLLMLLVTWPVMLVTAIAIVAESGGRGPIFYKQIRVGRHGRPFEILKFRSMRVDAEVAGKPQWATTNDSRITQVGSFIRKTRIDELPQLLNVVRGQMSFVGPRPERPEFVEELSRRIPYYELRHRVNPGITGWAQICYPYGASEHDAREKLQYDLYYLKNYSLFLDLTILIQTAQVILWGKGAR